MARHNITNAENLFTGEAYFGPANSGLRGIPMTPLLLISLGAPALGDADSLIDAATSTELPDTETVTYTFPGTASPVDGAMSDGILDFPRNVSIVTTHGSSVVAMTILITGLDEYGVVTSELVTVAATGTTQTDATLKTFKSITSIALIAAADAEANTVNIGTGDVLGLPYRIDSGEVVSIIEADNMIPTTGTLVFADTTDPATTTTGDVRGTYNPTQTLNGSLVTRLLVMVSGRASKVDAFGIDQV